MRSASFEGSINENTPTHPMSLYGISKDALRNAALLLGRECWHPRAMASRVHISSAIPITAALFLSKITAAEKKGQKLFPFTSGLNQWNFIDYEDFCTQTVAAVEQTVGDGRHHYLLRRPEKLS
jgi:dTDP-6-deoxy-L-talose 4-dehydrogenase (NAD+)